MKKSESSTGPDQALSIRLDAIIRLLIENGKQRKEMSEPQAAQILHSTGMSPTDIAKILGKKSATSVSSYLYGKKKPARKK